MPAFSGAQAEIGFLHDGRGDHCRRLAFDDELGPLFKTMMRSARSERHDVIFCSKQEGIVLVLSVLSRAMRSRTTDLIDASCRRSARRHQDRRSKRHHHPSLRACADHRATAPRREPSRLLRRPTESSAEGRQVRDRDRRRRARPPHLEAMEAPALTWVARRTFRRRLGRGRG